MLICGWMRCRCRRASGWCWGSGWASGPSTREVLVAAAVSGRVFAPELVGEVAGVNADALVDAFDEAERARLIAPGKVRW